MQRPFFLPDVLQVKGGMIFELQAFCGDLTDREQLTAKVECDQNETVMY